MEDFQELGLMQMEKEFKVESKPEFKGGMSESFTNFPKEL
jgi:hypothetical protein